jgi:tetratricopeptide (TPR) repeat protein
MSKKILKSVLAVITILLVTAGSKDVVFSGTLAEQAVEYRNKGYEVQKLGDIDKAIEYYQKAISINPYYATPHNDLGILYEEKGWFDRAETHYQKAIQIDPNYLSTYSNLALLYENRNEKDKASFYWMKRFKLGDPEDPWTQRAKERLRKLGLLDEEELERFKKSKTKKEEVEKVIAEAPREAPERKKWKKDAKEAERQSLLQEIERIKKEIKSLAKRRAPSQSKEIARLQEELEQLKEVLTAERKVTASDTAQRALAKETQKGLLRKIGK